MISSKLTYYVEGFDSDGPQVETVLADAGVPIIKINTLERAKALLKNYPRLKVAYRDIPRFEDPFRGTYAQGDAEELAGRWFTEAMKVLYSVPEDNRPRLYISGPFNEPGELENADKLSWFGTFEKRRALLLNSAGFGCSMFALSAEANIYDKWLPLRPAIAYAIGHNCLFETHGYNSPRLDDGGPSGRDTHFLFNHRPLVTELVKAGYHVPPGFFFYGEFGIDSIISSGKNYPGWLTTGCSAQDYAYQLMKADAELMSDVTVLGAAIYIWLNHNEANKDNYNIRFPRQTGRRQLEQPTVAEILLSYIASSQPEPAPAPQPEPTPEPAPAGVSHYRVKSPYLNIRQGPNASAVDYGDLMSGSIVTTEDTIVTGSDGHKWARLVGWVAVDLLDRV